MGADIDADVQSQHCTDSVQDEDADADGVGAGEDVIEVVSMEAGASAMGTSSTPSAGHADRDNEQLSIEDKVDHILSLFSMAGETLQERR